MSKNASNRCIFRGEFTVGGEKVNVWKEETIELEVHQAKSLPADGFDF